MVIFVDTSALLALVDVSDEFHSQAFSTWEQLLASDDTLVTNNYVIVESISLAQRRVGMDAVRIIKQDITPYLDVDWMDEGTHSSALDHVLSANRRSLSLVDRSSFDTMRRLEIEPVFSFDPHFREQGFSVIP